MMRPCFHCHMVGNVWTGDTGRRTKNMVRCHICDGTGFLNRTTLGPRWIEMPGFDDPQNKLFEGASVKADDFDSMEAIGVHIGLFPSKTQARKNGWSGPVVKGPRKAGRLGTIHIT